MMSALVKSFLLASESWVTAGPNFIAMAGGWWIVGGDLRPRDIFCIGLFWVIAGFLISLIRAKWKAVAKILET